MLTRRLEDEVEGGPPSDGQRWIETDATDVARIMLTSRLCERIT